MIEEINAASPVLRPEEEPSNVADPSILFTLY
jgi:hypothetical protein